LDSAANHPLSNGSSKGAELAPARRGKACFCMNPEAEVHWMSVLQQKLCLLVPRGHLQAQFTVFCLSQDDCGPYLFS
jgi:hypothetical protein